VSTGKYTITDYTIAVSELPIGVWTEDYKAHLDKLEIDDVIHNYVNNSTEDTVNFVIKVKRDILIKWKQEMSIEKNLKLTSNINAQNMHNVSMKRNEIVKMYSAEEVLYHLLGNKVRFSQKGES